MAGLATEVPEALLAGPVRRRTGPAVTKPEDLRQMPVLTRQRGPDA